MKYLSHILSAIGYEGYCDHDVTLSALQNDSRQVMPGDLFLAYPGHAVDGRDYIAQAIDSGAVACLVEAVDFQPQSSYAVPVIEIRSLQAKISTLAAVFANDPSANLDLVGITGTNGKSSCVQFIGQAFEALNLTVGVLGTVGNGVWPHLVSSPLTTLDAIGIHQYLQQYVLAGASVAAMEVSSHALQQKRVDNLQFKVAVFTSLSHEHLDYHGSLEEYAKAKYQLFQFPSLQCGVVNLDDEYGRRLIKERTDIRWIGYSVENRLAVQGCDLIRAHAISQSKTGISFEVETAKGVWPLTLPLLGRFNIGNVLAVIGVLDGLGFSVEQIQQATRQLSTVKGRMQVIVGQHHPTVVIDYAHTPDALEKALLAVSEHFSSSIYCLFGCGGDRDRQKRPLMAQIAQRYAEKVVVTSDHSRSESFHQIYSDIRSGFSTLENVFHIEDRAQAIAFAVQSAGIDDIVLLAGMGHEIALTEKRTLRPMTDADLARQVLARLEQ